MRKVIILSLFSVLLFAWGASAQDDSVSVVASDGYNVKGGYELFPFEWRPHKGKWLPARDHGYYRDTLICLGYVWLRKSGSGVPNDTFARNAKLLTIDNKLDSLPTGDSLGGKPCYLARVPFNFVTNIRVIHDTSVTRR
jgi:hypothetical protein